jgi:glycosyltransferase involved in cell wall biosynthesis
VSEREVRSCADILVVIPAFREACRLPGVLERLAEACPDAQVVVVDDCSPDATAAVALAGGAITLRHPFNLGYGAAIQTGYLFALSRGAACVVQMDADGQHDPADVPRLAAPVLRGDCDLVIGSRFLEPAGYRMSASKRLGRHLFRLIGRGLGIEVSDPTSGFQALGPSMLALYADEHFPADFPDVDVLVAAHRRGMRIREIPVHMSEGERPSLLHGGLATFYYPYKMLLSLWAGALNPRRGRKPGTEEGRDG